MTPQQQQLNNDLPHVMVFKDLEEKVAGLDGKVVELRAGQKIIEGNMENLRKQMEKGFTDVSKSIGGLKQDLQNDEIKKLRDELGVKRAFRNTVASGLIIAIATIILTVVFSNIPSVTFNKAKETVISK